MIHISKLIGETPLEALERLRIDRPELKDEVLSYAGRLDPMAEGEMLVMVGEENGRREEFMSYDKQYVGTFLVGVRTDSLDALGLIEGEGETEISKDRVVSAVQKLLELREQTYPWFSGQTVNGVKLFDHYKRGNRDIVRPKLSVRVDEATLVSIETVPAKEVLEYIQNSIDKVNGDFRQEEILTRWKEYFKTHTGRIQTFEVRFRVSSGTYIRAFVEQFDFPATLLKLKRTRILMK